MDYIYHKNAYLFFANPLNTYIHSRIIPEKEIYDKLRNLMNIRLSNQKKKNAFFFSYHLN